eukprot:6817031-Ditylum_brightwellii.AAC.2
MVSLCQQPIRQMTLLSTLLRSKAIAPLALSEWMLPPATVKLYALPWRCTMEQMVAVMVVEQILTAQVAEYDVARGRFLTNCLVLDAILLVGDGEADIGECSGGKCSCVASCCIETCIADKELDVLEEEKVWLDVAATKAVFPGAKKEEEDDPDEVKDCVGVDIAATEECFHSVEHANWDGTDTVMQWVLLGVDSKLLLDAEVGPQSSKYLYHRMGYCSTDLLQTGLRGTGSEMWSKEGVIWSHLQKSHHLFQLVQSLFVQEQVAVTPGFYLGVAKVEVGQEVKRGEMSMVGDVVSQVAVRASEEEGGGSEGISLKEA